MNSETAGRLGFVGIGTMGAPMVRVLRQAGHAPALLDANPAAAEAVAAETGLTVCQDGASLGAICDVVILMLPRSDIVRAVCLGASGLASGMAAGSVIVDMGSSDPQETRRLGGDLAGRGITLLDAPVSGGVRKAAAGTLAIMLGADDAAAAARVLPVLQAMGRVLRTGGLGSGHASKALNNYVSAAGLAAACEALIIGREFGLDPGTLVDVLNASTGRNNSTENKLAQFVLSGAFRDAGFALDLMAKDVALAQGLSDSLGVDLPGVAAARSLWAAASAALPEGADHTEIFRHLDAMAGAHDR